MVEIEDVLELLDLEIDKRLYNLTQKQLITLLMRLAQYKTKKDLAKLISDDAYFQLGDLIKSLEKTEKNLLFQILNEPQSEKMLRLPIANWLKEEGYEYDFEVPLPRAGRRRLIDVVGYKKGGLFGGGKIIAVEIKTATSRSAIDSAFSQARDYCDCSDLAYVAVSPYVFLKYSDILIDKTEKYENEIGLLLVDKLRVIAEVTEAEETDYDKKKYENIKSHFE